MSIHISYWTSLIWYHCFSWSANIADTTRVYGTLKPCSCFWPRSPWRNVLIRMWFLRATFRWMLLHVCIGFDSEGSTGMYRYVKVIVQTRSNLLVFLRTVVFMYIYIYPWLYVHIYIYIYSYLESHSAIVVLFQRPWIFSWSLRLWSSGAAFGGDDLTEHYFFPWPEHVWLLVFQVYIQWWYMHIYVWYDMIWYDMIWYDMIWYDMIWYDMIVYIYILYLYLHYDDGMMICTYDIIYIWL